MFVLPIISQGLNAIEFDYVNYRGEKSHRRVLFQRITYWGNEWHRDPQWLMVALDLDKGVTREFAMKDMTNVGHINVP